MRKRKVPTFAEKLVKLLNEEVAPFAGVEVSAVLDSNGGAVIVIGNRDLDLSPSGRVQGAGTCLVTK